MVTRILILDEGFMSGAHTARGLAAAGHDVAVLAATGGRGRCATAGVHWRLAPTIDNTSALERAISASGIDADVIYPVTEPLRALSWNLPPRLASRLFPEVRRRLGGFSTTTSARCPIISRVSACRFPRSGTHAITRRSAFRASSRDCAVAADRRRTSSHTRGGGTARDRAPRRRMLLRARVHRRRDVHRRRSVRARAAAAHSRRAQGRAVSGARRTGVASRDGGRAGAARVGARRVRGASSSPDLAAPTSFGGATARSRFSRSIRVRGDRSAPRATPASISSRRSASCSTDDVLAPTCGTVSASRRRCFRSIWRRATSGGIRRRSRARCGAISVRSRDGCGITRGRRRTSAVVCSA